MANASHSKLQQIIEDLSALKDTSAEVIRNVHHLSRDQINVLSASMEKVAIRVNLNQSESDDDMQSETRDNGSDSDDNNGDDNEDDETECRDFESESNAANGSNNCDDFTSRRNHFITNENKYTIRSLRRTISEGNNEEHTRGILKYPRDWNRRTYSESGCDNSDLQNANYIKNGLSNGYLEESGSDDEVYSQNKPKKNVRFNDTVSKTVFRANSSILGRKVKNQKRRNRKQAKNTSKKPANESSKPCNDSCVESQRVRQDSGYDSEDNGREDVKLKDCSLLSHKHMNNTGSHKFGIQVN